MKTHNLLLSALLLLPSTPVAQGALFEKQIIVSAAEAALRTPAPSDPTALIQALEWQVLEASNRERALVGLSPLTADPALNAAAARYSRKMRDFQFFDHVAPDGETLDQRLPESEKWRYQGLAENLWSGQGALDWQSSSVSAQAARNWVESPGHRENLFSPEYSVAGVGSAMRGDQLYVTMLYGTPVDDPEQAILQRDFGDAPADVSGFALSLEQSLTQAINVQRGQVGLPGLGPDPILSQAARNNAQTALSSGGFASGGVLDQVFQSDPTRSGRLAAGFWRGSGALIWKIEEVTRQVVQSWSNAQTWSDALDSGFGQVGVGVASDGQSVMVTILFGQGPA